jgi:hypothetical protein
MGGSAAEIQGGSSLCSDHAGFARMPKIGWRRFCRLRSGSLLRAKWSSGPFRATNGSVRLARSANKKAPQGGFFIGGQGGIRTHDTLAGMPHFECGAFNRSTTCPLKALIRKGPPKGKKKQGSKQKRGPPLFIRSPVRKNSVLLPFYDRSALEEFP